VAQKKVRFLGRGEDDKRRDAHSTAWRRAGSVLRHDNEVTNRQPPEDEVDPSALAPRSGIHRSNAPTLSGRRSRNFEGALPLLLIGSALLCYAAVLANEELGSKSAHLPLWGLFGAVGAVIAGAGIYSTFFVPSEAKALDLPKDWVTIPKAEWEALRASQPTVAPPPSPLPAPPVVAHPFPSRRVAPRPIWEEDWDVDSEGFRAAAAPPAPADFVLRQIEEIDAALRKKRTRPPLD